MPDLHIHVPEGFSGTVHIHHDGDVTTLAAEAGTESIQAGSAGAGPDDVESILAAHKRRDPHTRCRDVCEALVAEGWEALPSMARDGKGVSDARYVRLVYRGSARQIVTYLNSKTLGVFGRAEQAFAARLPCAEVLRSGVYFRHSDGDFDQVLSNAAALCDVANGQQTTD